MFTRERFVTVTLNPAIDHTLVVPNFSAGAVNRVQSSRIDAGGKGINVASFLADFGQPTTVTGFLGSDNDAIFRRLFSEKGIEDHCVRIAGPTRTGLKITDPILRQTTDINFPGETPSQEDLAGLFARLEKLASVHKWFVLSGSVPRGLSNSIYADIMRALDDRTIVLDTSGEALRLALPARPRVIKPNVEELSELMERPLSSPAAILAAGRELIAQHGITTVVVSMGSAGAIFIERSEAVWAVPPAVEVKSTVGAGDAMVAGIVASKMYESPLAECARLATAFSVTAIARAGHSLPMLAEIEAAAARVTLKDLL